MSNLAWIDLETTGLDPDVHDILEIGIIITDRELNEVARESWSISATPYPERVTWSCCARRGRRWASSDGARWWRC